MLIHRFHPDDSLSWTAFPQLQARALGMLEEYCPELNRDYYKHALRQRWITNPELTYYLGMLDDEGAMVAHLIAWVEVAWGKPYVNVNQLEADEGANVIRYRRQTMDGLDEWVRGLNRRYEQVGDPTRISGYELWTWKSLEWWGKYLPRKITSARNVIRWNVQEQPSKIASSKVGEK